MSSSLIKLTSVLETGNAIVVCGAGISIMATSGQAPSWRELITNAIDVTNKKKDSRKGIGISEEYADDCRLMLNSAKSMRSLLELANQIQDSLGGIHGAEYRNWLGSIFGRLQNSRPEILIAIEAMGNRGAKFATTNYDTLLAQHMKDTEAISSLYPAMVDDMLEGRRKGVWHIHGCYDQPESIVFSANDYRRIRSQSLQQFLLKSASKNFTLIFVGCSHAGLSDDNIGNLLEWFGDSWGHTNQKHFALCLENEVKNPWPNAVLPVIYGKEFDDLPNFLFKIAPQASSLSASIFPADPQIVGRKFEKLELVKIITTETAPIIIPGGPGMGKTSLAISAAHALEVAKIYEGQRFFVPLDSATDSNALLHALANALDVPASGSTANILAAIRDRVRIGVLVILDNFETPWQTDQEKTEELIRQLSLPGLRIIITIRGQTPSCGHCLDDLGPITDPDEAVEIFLRSAGGLRGVLSREPKLRDFIAKIDGHPLSLRLLGCASQGYGSLTSLERQWAADRAHLLRFGETESRHTSTQASLRTSLASRLLKDTSKQLLSILAYLPHGLDRNDADLIFPNIGADSVSNIVSSKIAYENEGRIVMLAPLREATLIELPASCFDKFSLISHFLGIAASSGKAGRRDWPMVREKVLKEAGNLDAVCLLAIAENFLDQLISPLRGLARFYRFTGTGSVVALETAAIRFEELGRVDEAASCLLSLAAIQIRAGNVIAAEVLFHRSLQLFESIGSEIGKANCIQGLAKIALEKHNFEDARLKFNISMEIYEEDSNYIGMANCIRGLGDLEVECGSIEIAKELYYKALPIYGKSKDKLGEAICMKSIAEIFAKGGAPDTAIPIFYKAISEFRELGDLLREAECKLYLGDVFEKKQNFELAKRHWESALVILKRIGYMVQAGHAHIRLGRIESESELRQVHLDAAIDAWVSMDRTDLVAENIG